MFVAQISCGCFYLEEEAVGKASYSGPSYFRMHHLEGEWTWRDDLYSGVYRQSKSHPKVRMNAFVPSERFLQVCIRFRYPDDRQRHCFLSRPALTCFPGNDFIRVALSTGPGDSPAHRAGSPSGTAHPLPGSPTAHRAIQMFPPPTDCRFHSIPDRAERHVATPDSALTRAFQTRPIVPRDRFGMKWNENAE